ncbi:hypothetical protein C8F01DRAFT_344792 [Mycena amicta]|nr:hypothetical protein C8F01DRAFT_344792 [Mycena amicta]
MRCAQSADSSGLPLLVREFLHTWRFLTAMRAPGTLGSFFFFLKKASTGNWVATCLRQDFETPEMERAAVLNGPSPANLKESRQGIEKASCLHYTISSQATPFFSPSSGGPTSPTESRQLLASLLGRVHLRPLLCVLRQLLAHLLLPLHACLVASVLWTLLSLLSSLWRREYRQGTFVGRARCNGDIFTWHRCSQSVAFFSRERRRSFQLPASPLVPCCVMILPAEPMGPISVTPSFSEGTPAAN